MMALRSQDKKELLARMEPAEEFVLVDGYNIIFAWDELKEIGRDSLDAARHVLMNLLCNYQGYRGCNLILVFDAYKVPQNLGTVEKYHNIFIVYTQEAETADSYIERVTYELRGRKKVRVATSDNLEQLIILGHGAVRVSAKSFHDEVMQTQQECPECGGDGHIIKNPCKVCSGRGLVRRRTTVHVKVPAGINNGQAINMHGQGHVGRNGGPTAT